MRTRFPVVSCAFALLAVFFVPVPLQATPRWHPFTYTTATLPAGATELEIYVDLVPGSRTVQGLMGMPNQTYDGAYFMPQIEIEHGITDRFQLAFYNTFEQPNGGSLRYDGVRLESIYRFSSPDWPLQMAGYLEVGYKGDEVEIEERLLLERAFGPLHVNANLWVEEEFGRRVDSREVDVRYRPTLALGYEISPAVHVGAEYWSLYHQVRLDGGATDFQMLHYAGPTLSLVQGEWWVAAGVYARLYQPASLVTGSDDELQFNSLWARLVVGGTL